MTPYNLPRHYDAWKLRAPSERDMNAETEARNERDDRRYHARKDDEMTEGKERR
jgi:hypothetical protein